MLLICLLTNWNQKVPKIKQNISSRYFGLGSVRKQLPNLDKLRPLQFRDLIYNKENNEAIFFINNEKKKFKKQFIISLRFSI